MFNYLIRRSAQMLVVLFFSAAASYALLNLAPGGPLAGLAQAQQNSRFRITAEDIARIRAYFELDLNLPIRFSRWLLGQPRGPITIGGQTFFADLIIGCRQPRLVEALMSDGSTQTIQAGCKPGQDVTLADLVGRRTSNGVVFGDFGNSWGMLRDRPVSLVVFSRLPRTLQLMSISITISILIGVPLGVFSAVKQYSKFDYFVTSLSFFGTSMPTFFFGLLMILVFSIFFKSWGWVYLPPANAESIKDYTMPILGTVDANSNLDKFLHLLMPVSVLAMVNVAGWSRFVRGSMLEVLRQDYVRTARAKGLLERAVIAKHALRNALIPFVTLVVFSIPAAFGGAIVTETIFNWPGMGRLYFDALGRYDYPVAMALLLITAVLTVIATLLSDVLYTVVDPRIRLS
ncbi:MAG: ABC transporter permease [Chloroflexi bacterium]|nr:ABC transporter permease [Chloroflexota bacterium]